MKQGKLLEFIKQWKALERRQKDLDFERAKWCAELRAEFPSGIAGDKSFKTWLSVELALTIEQQNECLDRATAFQIIPDNHQWDELGGYRQVSKLVPLDKRERVAVIGAAKTTGYRIATIVRQRESEAKAPSPTMQPRTPDVVVLAEFIEQLDSVPDDVREVARRHIRARALKVA